MNSLFNAGKSLKGIRDMARAMSTVGQIRKLISGKDPAQVAQVLAKTNPQFAAFWDKNASRPLNDVLQEYGIDAEGFQSFLSLF